MTDLLQQAAAIDSTGVVSAGRQFILGKFGAPGLIAAIILLVCISVLLISKLLKIAFDVLRYVVVPSVAITFIATYFLPFSFVYILPVTVAFFSIVLFFKG